MISHMIGRMYNFVGLFQDKGLIVSVCIYNFLVELFSKATWWTEFRICLALSKVTHIMSKVASVPNVISAPHLLNTLMDIWNSLVEIFSIELWVMIGRKYDLVGSFKGQGHTGINLCKSPILHVWDCTISL